MNDKDRELVIKATDWLKRNGEFPTDAEIMLELARRANEAIELYKSVSHELACIKNTRP